MSEVQQYHKKKNLFRFFKSKEFSEARAKLCAMYIILSYANELHEDIDRLLQGFEGLYIGELKHKSKLATKALEAYDREYRLHINDAGELCDETIDVTTELDNALKQSQFFLQEANKAIRQVLDNSIEKQVKEVEQISKDFAEDFEIIGEQERKQTLQKALELSKNRLAGAEVPDVRSAQKGVEIGFNIAINWINQVYLEA